jgi:hypothetical protein
VLHVPRMSDVSRFCGRDGDRMSLSELATFLELVMAVEPEVSRGGSRVRVQGLDEDAEPIQNLLYMEHVLPVELVPHAITVAQLLTGDVAEMAASLQRDVLSKAWQVDYLQLVQETRGAKWAGSISLVGQPTSTGKANTRVRSGYASKALCRLALICEAVMATPESDDLYSMHAFEAALLEYRDGGGYEAVLDALPAPLMSLRAWVEGVLAEETFESAVILRDQALDGSWEMALSREELTKDWVCVLKNASPPFGRRAASKPYPDVWISITMAVLDARIVEIKMPTEVGETRC